MFTVTVTSDAYPLSCATASIRMSSDAKLFELWLGEDPGISAKESRDQGVVRTNIAARNHLAMIGSRPKAETAQGSPLPRRHRSSRKGSAHRHLNLTLISVQLCICPAPTQTIVQVVATIQSGISL